MITVTCMTEPACAVAITRLYMQHGYQSLASLASLHERGRVRPPLLKNTLASFLRKAIRDRRCLAHRDVSGSHVSGYPLSCVQTELGLSFDSKGQVRADTHGRGWVGVDLHRRGVGQVMWGGAVLKNAANSHSSTPTHVSWASSSGC